MILGLADCCAGTKGCSDARPACVAAAGGSEVENGLIVGGIGWSIQDQPVVLVQFPVHEVVSIQTEGSPVRLLDVLQDDDLETPWASISLTNRFRSPSTTSRLRISSVGLPSVEKCGVLGWSRTRRDGIQVVC